MGLQQPNYDDEGVEAKQLNALERAQQNHWGMAPKPEQNENQDDDDSDGLNEAEESAPTTGKEKATKAWGAEPTLHKNNKPELEGPQGGDDEKAPGFSFNKEGRAKAMEAGRGLKKKLKKKLLLGGMLGAVILMFLLVVSLFLSSLKLEHFVANIGTYEFARLGRNFGNSVAAVTEEKIAIDSADETLTQTLKAKYGALRSKTWGKLDAYRPQKVLGNMKADGKLEYIFESEPRRFKIPGIGSDTKEVLKGVKINGEELRFNEGKWFNFFDNRNGRLEFNGRLTAQMQDALHDTNSLVRGRVAQAVRDELGTKLRRWERLTKPYRDAKAAEADNIKQTYETTKTTPAEKAGVSAVADAEEQAKKAADDCIKDKKCLDQVAKDDGAALRTEINRRISSALETSDAVRIAGAASSFYQVALPLCMIYEGSVQNSGSTVDANTARNEKAYYTVASAADEHRAGEADSSQVGGLADELGDIVNTPSERIARGETIDPDAYPNPESSSSRSYSIFDALFGGLRGDVMNAILDPTCPTITEPAVGVTLAAAEIGAKVIAAAGTAGTGTVAVEGAEQAAGEAVKVTVGQILKQVVKDISLKDLAKKAVRDGVLIGGATLLANLIVQSRMGNMETPIPNSKDLAIQAHQGGIAIANETDKKMLYGRPMTTPEIVKSNYDDLQDIAFKNSQKSLFDRFLSPDNPTSTLSNTAISLNSTLKSSIPNLMQKIVSSVSSLLEPGNLLSSLTSFRGEKAAALTIGGSPYKMVQWGWTDQEEAVIKAHPELYSPLNNAETLENSGKLENIKSTYDKCFTKSMGELLADGLIQRDDDGKIKPDRPSDPDDDEGLCAPNNLGPNNADAFSFRIYMRNENTLTHMTDIQSPTNGVTNNSPAPAPSEGTPTDPTNPDGTEPTAGTFIWPLADQTATVNSCWGDDRTSTDPGYFHSGLDLHADKDTPVLASAAGKVVWASDSGGGLGKVVILQHDNGLYTQYQHLNSYKVAVGDTVTQGQTIALSGNTGTGVGNGGYHLHFNIQRSGTQQSRASGTLNPLDYLQADSRNMTSYKEYHNPHPQTTKCVPSSVDVKGWVAA